MRNHIFFFIVSIFILCVPHGVFALEVAEVPLQTGSIIDGINMERKAHNLPLFEQNEALMRAAQLKAADIAKRGVLEHTKVSADGLWWPLVQAGYQYESAGENLSEGIEDPKLLVSDWMDSPEHRVNILNAQYMQIGVGIATGMFDGELVSYVVEYTAKPKPIITQTKVETRSIASAGTNSSVLDLEARKAVLKQLIALLTEYLNLLIAQQKQ